MPKLPEHGIAERFGRTGNRPRNGRGEADGTESSLSETNAERDPETRVSGPWDLTGFGS
jgi:hypothetical protein